jgi:hypothetical protein
MASKQPLDPKDVKFERFRLADEGLNSAGRGCRAHHIPTMQFVDSTENLPYPLNKTKALELLIEKLIRDRLINNVPSKKEAHTMVKQQQVAEAVDHLSDALNTLADFEKFYESLLRGHYGNVPSIGDLAEEDAQALVDDMTNTRTVLVHYAVACAKSVVYKAAGND